MCSAVERTVCATFAQLQHVGWYSAAEDVQQRRDYPVCTERVCNQAASMLQLLPSYSSIIAAAFCTHYAAALRRPIFSITNYLPYVPQPTLVENCLPLSDEIVGVHCNSNVTVFKQYWYVRSWFSFAFGALWHCWLGGRKGIRPARTVDCCMVFWWWCDWSFARVRVPVHITAITIISCYIKIQNGLLHWYRIKQDVLEYWR